MLERIMNLQILLCIMAAAGAFGAVGMLAVKNKHGHKS